MYQISHVALVSAPGVSLNIHEDEGMKSENWILLGWLSIVDSSKSLRPTRGYDGSPARNLRFQHECWKLFLSNWNEFSSEHRVVIYGDGIAWETMQFIAGLLGDQQVLYIFYLCMSIILTLLILLVYCLCY